VLRWLGVRAQKRDGCSGSAYQDRSKVEALFGPGIWIELRDKVVIDFGCGTGAEAIEVARCGAKKVVGVDVRESVLIVARGAAVAAGMWDRCIFSTRTDEQADVILSIDGLEHYGDPEHALTLMRQLVRDDGKVFIAFGPPWFHPLGGHLFSVFPWAHLIFTEKAFIRWRSDFKSDGATRFCEVEGGLNQMTVRRARQLLDKSAFTIASFEAVPIKRVRAISRWLPREFFTSVVRCTLIPANPTAASRGVPRMVGPAAKDAA
jgi:SAM-dependent methyltransferase